MSDPTPAAPIGRRERKRRETENRIELSAATLALQKGFGQVTVEEICDAADVSRSTFFNYFPSRDAAILGRPMEILTGAEAEAVLSEFAGDLPRGVFSLIFASVGHDNVNADVARARIELSATQPDARRAGTAILVDAGAQLMASAAQWLRDHPEHARLDDPDAEASHAANAAYAALSTMAGGWVAGTGDVSAGIEAFDAAMADLRIVVGA